MRLRGQGDILKNHVVQVSPKENTTNVALDFPISVRFDANVAQIDTSEIFEVKINGNKLNGVTIYDMNTRTVTFAVNGIFPPGKKVDVTVQAKAFQNQTQRMWLDYNFSFTTQNLASINVLIQVKGSEKKQVIKSILYFISFYN